MIVRNNVSALTYDNSIRSGLNPSKYDQNQIPAANTASESAQLSISDNAMRKYNSSTSDNENIQNLISRLQMNQGSLTNMNDMLTEMTVLCVQASKHNDSPELRRTITQKISQLKIQLSEEIAQSDTGLSDEALGLDQVNENTLANASSLVKDMQGSVSNQLSQLEDQAMASLSSFSSQATSFKLDDNLFKTNAQATAKSQTPVNRSIVASLLG